jgi:hypothetical protein
MHRHTNHRSPDAKFDKHDLESMKASEEGKAEVAFYRDPQCAEVQHHRANCDCRGAARAPITPRS